MMVHLSISVWQRVVLREVNVMRVNGLLLRESRPACPEEACFTTFVSCHLSDGSIFVGPTIEPLDTTVFQLTL
jgi:hypothetical protein